MSFYHDIKPHMSPSALANWLNSRGAFVKSYFQQEEFKETKAMQGGTTIHALIEAGLIKAKCAYDIGEVPVTAGVGRGFYFMGIPDSRQALTPELDGVVNFVDYKSGKANAWADKLPTDIKMKATAWLVWKVTGTPRIVRGHVEFIQTTWDPETKQVIPLEGFDHEVVSIDYTYDELEAFTNVILRAMDDVNEFYEKWLKSTGDFVNSGDVEAFIELREKIEKESAELDELAQRILSQMEFGGEENHKTPIGTFYITTRKTYKYPPNLAFKVDDQVITLKEADKYIAGARAAKSNYELANEPESMTRSISFRSPKQ